MKNDTPKHTDLSEGFAPLSNANNLSDIGIVPLRPRLKNERKSDIIDRKKMGKSNNKGD